MVGLRARLAARGDRGAERGVTCLSWGKSIPGLARFRLHMRKTHARWRIGNANQMLASWALNLPASMLRFALQWLIAMGTVEFEFIGAHSLCLRKRNSRAKSMSKSFPILFDVKLRLNW